MAKGSKGKGGTKGAAKRAQQKEDEQAMKDMTPTERTQYKKDKKAERKADKKREAERQAIEGKGADDGDKAKSMKATAAPETENDRLQIALVSKMNKEAANGIFVVRPAPAAVPSLSNCAGYLGCKNLRDFLDTIDEHFDILYSLRQHQEDDYGYTSEKSLTIAEILALHDTIDARDQPITDSFEGYEEHLKCKDIEGNFERYPISQSSGSRRPVSIFMRHAFAFIKRAKGTRTHLFPGPVNTRQGRQMCGLWTEDIMRFFLLMRLIRDKDRSAGRNNSNGAFQFLRNCKRTRRNHMSTEGDVALPVFKLDDGPPLPNAKEREGQKYAMSVQRLIHELSQRRDVAGRRVPGADGDQTTVDDVATKMGQGSRKKRTHAILGQLAQIDPDGRAEAIAALHASLQVVHDRTEEEAQTEALAKGDQASLTSFAVLLGDVAEPEDRPGQKADDVERRQADFLRVQRNREDAIKALAEAYNVTQDEMDAADPDKVKDLVKRLHVTQQFQKFQSSINSVSAVPREFDAIVQDMGWETEALKDGTPTVNRHGIQLYPHQVVGAMWCRDMLLSHLHSALLADETGLGKTIQSLTCLELIKEAQEEAVREAGLLAPAHAPFPIYLPERRLSKAEKHAIRTKKVENREEARRQAKTARAAARAEAGDDSTTDDETGDDEVESGNDEEDESDSDDDDDDEEDGADGEGDDVDKGQEPNEVEESEVDEDDDDMRDKDQEDEDNVKGAFASSAYYSRATKVAMDKAIRENEEKKAAFYDADTAWFKPNIVYAPAGATSVWLQEITTAFPDLKVYSFLPAGGSSQKASLGKDFNGSAHDLERFIKTLPVDDPRTAQVVFVTSYTTAPARFLSHWWKTKAGKWFPTKKLTRAECKDHDIDPDEFDVMRLEGVKLMAAGAGTKEYKLRISTNLFGTSLWDEAHKLKNMDTQQIHTLVDLEHDRILLLTASPFMKRLKDMVSIMKICKSATEPNEEATAIFPPPDGANAYAKLLDLLKEHGGNYLACPPEARAEIATALDAKKYEELMHKYDDQPHIVRKVVPTVLSILGLRRVTGQVIQAGGKECKIAGDIPAFHATLVELEMGLLEALIYCRAHRIKIGDPDRIVKEAVPREKDANPAPIFAQEPVVDPDTESHANIDKLRRLQQASCCAGLDNLYEYEVPAKAKTVQNWYEEHAGDSAAMAFFYEATNTGWAPMPDNRIAQAAYITATSAKFKYVVKEFERLRLLGKKGLLYCDWPAEVWIGIQLMQILGHKAARISSGQSAKERADLIKRFNDPLDDGIMVLVCSSRSAAESLNFQKACHHIIIMDVVNFNTILQIIGRCYRIGQQHEQYIKILHLNRTYDQYLLATHATAMVAQLAATSTGAMSEITLEEIQDRLKDSAFAQEMQNRADKSTGSRTIIDETRELMYNEIVHTKFRQNFGVRSDRDNPHWRDPNQLDLPLAIPAEQAFYLAAGGSAEARVMAYLKRRGETLPDPATPVHAGRRKTEAYDTSIQKKQADIDTAKDALSQRLEKKRKFEDDQADKEVKRAKKAFKDLKKLYKTNPGMFAGPPQEPAILATRKKPETPKPSGQSSEVGSPTPAPKNTGSGAQASTSGGKNVDGMPEVEDEEMPPPPPPKHMLLNPETGELVHPPSPPPPPPPPSQTTISSSGEPTLDPDAAPASTATTTVNKGEDVPMSGTEHDVAPPPGVPAAAIEEASAGKADNTFMGGMEGETAPESKRTDTPVGDGDEEDSGTGSQDDTVIPVDAERADAIVETMLDRIGEYLDRSFGDKELGLALKTLNVQIKPGTTPKKADKIKHFQAGSKASCLRHVKKSLASGEDPLGDEGVADAVPWMPSSVGKALANFAPQKSKGNKKSG